MKSKKMNERIQEIAWRGLFARPDLVYNDWLSDDLNNVKELVKIFDELNDKLNRPIDQKMADVYKQEFMDKIKGLE
jgi:hypothetical protein